MEGGGGLEFAVTLRTPFSFSDLGRFPFSKNL